MYCIHKNTMFGAYAELIKQLLNTGSNVGDTKEINNCCLVVDHPSIEHYSLPFRNVSEKYLLAELKWYWSGDNSCKTIGQFAKLWLAITDDGETSNSAYGYILQKKYGFNQIEQIIELLKKDPTSRRAVLNISDPSINRITTKDMQCTVAIQFLIRNGKLEETVYMRSNDVYFGLPYDYVYFVSIAKYIASKLGVEIGTYTHHATSMHMYNRDIEKFDMSIIGKDINIDIDSIIKENYHEE